MANSRRHKGAPRSLPRLHGLRTILLLLTAVAVLIVLPLAISFSLLSVRYLRSSEEEIATTARLSVISARKLTEMYQDTVVQAATLTLMDPALGEIASLSRLEDVRGSFDAYTKLSRVVSLLTSMTYIASLRINSVYLYLDAADYVISSDEGAIRLAQFRDGGFQDVYRRLQENPSASVWCVREVPIRTADDGSRELAAYLTYANMANPIVSKVRGAIFVNIRETTLSSMINSHELDTEGKTFIVDPGGAILSHVDKSLILRNVSEVAGASAVFGGQRAVSTSAAVTSGSRRSLFVTAYSDRTSWTYVAEHSLSALTAKVRGLLRTGILVMAAIALLGSGVVVSISTRISIPLRRLFSSLSQWNPGVTTRRRTLNEFEYLFESFQRIRDREARLHRTVDESHDKLWEAYIVDLLRGDRDKYAEEPFPDTDIVPAHGSFRVLTVSLDRRADLVSRFSQEQRLTYLSLLSAECQKALSGDFHSVAVLMDGNVSAAISSAAEDSLGIPRISTIVSSLQERFTRMLGTTLTVGVSGLHAGDLAALSMAYDESIGAVQRRIREGHGKIHAWEPAPLRESRYPYEVEAKLLTLLRAGDIAGAEASLGALFSLLGEMPCGDIPSAVEQLCGAVARFMRDNGIKRTGARGIFDEMAERETLGEMKALLSEICRMVAAETSSGSTVLVERIMHYVRAHFAEIIDFEAMARDVGISYSYMRRLMKERTGTSILEYQHSLRMDEATRLLSSPEISISAIARRLGYNNLQSFERFFKKSQAVSAKEYRRLLGNGQGARREGQSQIRRSVSKPTVYNSNPDPS